MACRSASVESAPASSTARASCWTLQHQEEEDDEEEDDDDEGEEEESLTIHVGSIDQVLEGIVGVAEAEGGIRKGVRQITQEFGGRLVEA